MMEDRNFTIFVISELPKKTTPRTPIGQAKEPLLLQTFWDNLPDEFEAKDFKEIASSRKNNSLSSTLRGRRTPISPL